MQKNKDGKNTEKVLNISGTESSAEVKTQDKNAASKKANPKIKTSNPHTQDINKEEEKTLSAPSLSLLPSKREIILPLPIPKVKPMACIIDIKASKLLAAAVMASSPIKDTKKVSARL